jgi:hypothetical protein
MPEPLVQAVRSHWCRRVAAHYRTRFSARSRRSASTIFSEVYEMNVWGGEAGEFHSGGGSDAGFAGPYSEYLRNFLAGLDAERLVVVDLGCGDFRVGGQLVSEGVEYRGVDVVPALVAHNQRTFGKPGVSFRCLDITEEDLPDGDICLVRQVLQHLSNAQIQSVLAKLQKYSHVFVTEHHFRDDADIVRNLDKPHGPDTRLAMNSGVYLDEPPFGLTHTEIGLVTPFDEWTELRTIHFAPGRVLA